MYMYFKKMALKYKELDHMIGVKQITKFKHVPIL